jgi:hypothetical protein
MELFFAYRFVVMLLLVLLVLSAPACSQNGVEIAEGIDHSKYNVALLLIVWTL